jgi:hypothetical protein
MPRQLFYISSAVYNVAIAFAKLSLLFFYRRLNPARWWQRCVLATMVFTTSYSIAIFCAMIFNCHPIAKNWDVTITDGYCHERGPLYISIAALQILTDVVLIVMPIPMLWGLQMPATTKCGLGVMFAIGSSSVSPFLHSSFDSNPSS